MLFSVFNFQLTGAKSFLWEVVCKFLLPIVCLPLKSIETPVLFLAPMDISSAVLRLLNAE